VERKGCGTRKILNAAGLAGALALALIANTARAQAQPNVEELMARVGEAEPLAFLLPISARSISSGLRGPVESESGPRW
jgi:hypothetical protein